MRTAWIVALATLGFVSVGAAQGQSMWARAEAIADAATDTCMAVVLDGRSFDQAAADGNWVAVDVSVTGSRLATHAWRASSLDTTFLMRLPNGGCSFGIDEGDSGALRARIFARLQARATFAAVMQEATRNGRATRYAYCTAGPHPFVVSIIDGGPTRPALVFNLFRASDAAPEFCRVQGV